MASIKERIDDCKIISLFRNESLEAGYILNILYNLDKLTEMKVNGQQLSGETSDVEELFMKSFWDEIKKFQIKTQPEADEIGAQAMSSPTNVEEVSIVEDLSTEMSSEMDALLSMAFNQCSMNTESQVDDRETSDPLPTDCFNCYERYVTASQLNR